MKRFRIMNTTKADNSNSPLFGVVTRVRGIPFACFLYATLKFCYVFESKPSILSTGLDSTCSAFNARE